VEAGKHGRHHRGLTVKYELRRLLFGNALSNIKHFFRHYTNCLFYGVRTMHIY
jgi:hypothetical protein